jgi:predicted esterase
MVLLFAILAMASHSALFGQTSPWEGDWITDLGEMSLMVDGEEVSGSLKDKDITGTVKDGSVKLLYQTQKRQGRQMVWVDATAKLELDKNGTAFKRSGKGSTFRGWKLVDDLDAMETADFSGHWLSNWGNMVLEQNGKKVTGIYGSQGLASLEGTVKGNRLNFTWKKLHWSGKAFIEQNEDGSRIYGTTYDTDDATKWIGVKASEFQHHATPKAGEIVKGYADNGMLYNLRMPDGWTDGDPVDVIVLFHGSNFTTLGMVHITAKNWPDIGKKFAILGIQGDKWADWSDADDLRHNYFYVNWMGRSTYKGYPYTDRESPSLVMEVLEELGDQYAFERTFVGGHSQGGYLAYVIQMHFADKVDGTFPVAGQMMIQCEPDVFDDEALMKAQRTTPMAIVHGKRDGLVPFSTGGEYAYNRLLAHGFPNVKLIAPSIGHPYDFLPVNEAIEYLDALTTDDPKLLLDYTNQQLSKKDWRTVGLAIRHAKELGKESDFKEISQKFESEASRHAMTHEKAIGQGGYGKWVDRFLRWREDFSLADAASDAMSKWNELAEVHTEAARALSSDSRKAFQSNDAQRGWELRKQIVLENFASPLYLKYREGVEKRFGKLDKLAKRPR